MKKNLPKLFEILSIFNESKIMWFKTLLIAVILAMSGNVYSQVIVPFNPRTSSYTPNQTIYHVKGDFTMLGNTNLILKDYSATKNNNNNDVIFVDIDNDPSTVNSSSATLVLSEENGATPECSNIIYAGLYWSGRTQRNDYENTWTTGGSTENVYNNNVINNAYTLNISQNGSWSNDNNRTATYTFTPSGGGDVVTFEFTTNYHSKEVKVSVGGGPATTINASYSSDWNNMTANFDTPYIINTGSANIKVNNLRKNTSSNTIDEDFRANVTYGGVTLNKQEVLFKATGDTYSTVSATNSNILYPQGDAYDQIYVAYAEVTDYVRQNGTAEYTVANIALREGKDDAGRSGGWGLVVVYENSKMKWRDVSIFDGYGYMKSSGNDAYLPVQGFNTVPSGDVNMKLGMMASEGDISAAGDFFAIQKLQSSDYERLNHSENSTDNFFNSSIYTGNNPRNPNITNNIGMDISMFNIPNADKSIIANGQTSTTFKYGTNGDGYVIYSIAMAVDAYVPEPEATVAIESVNSTPPGTEVLPNDIIEYSLEIRNIGTEDIENGKIIIPIPYTAEFVSSSGAFFQGLNGNQPYYDSGEGATGAIVWEFGDMPLYNPTTTLLGKLTFKLKVTTDCFILSNANCSPAVTLDGSISGIGHDSQVAVSNVGFIQGYQTSGSCEGAAIKDPLTMPINAGTYVSENCDGDYSTRDFSYCNFGGSNIPFSDVTANFPAGTRFYNEYPVTSSATEYTNATGFPGTVGKTYYYAVPPGITACYWQFTITVNDITSTPTANNINYCIGDVAAPLTATPSDNSYTLFYYTSATDDTPETSITPSTSTVGTTSYWVAEGLSNQCISPNKVKFEVKVNEVDATEVTADHKDVTCYDGNDGAFTASASGGDGNYTYSLKNDFSNSNTNGKFTGLTAGTYTVYVKDGNDCTDPTQLKVTITEPDEVDATEVTADHKDVTCYDGNDGAFTASASGGNGNYTYSLDAKFSNSNANGKFTGLTAGTYTVYVKDGNDCADPTQLKVTITEPKEVDATEVTADHKDVTCYDGNDGAFTASASGGDGNYTYSLKNDFSNSNTNGKFTGLTAGTYTVYVKDGNDCTDPSQLKVTITEPDEVDATEVTADHKDVTCYDGNDGAFTASASGGDGNYTYSLKNDFSNSNTNGKFTGLTAGTYTVYVKDGNDCTDPTQLKVTITEPDEVDATEVTADHKDVTCYDGNDGAFTASASGGNGNYTYSLDAKFSNSNANGKFTGLTAGTYTVYVKDGNDCADPTQLKVTITEPKEVDATEVTADHKDVTCYDGNDGAFTASASGGDGNYTYSLKNDFSNSNTNGKFTGLTAGTYTVYVKDGNDCTDPTQLKVTITEPDEVDATEVTADHKDVTCYDGNNGAFTASASGGDGNYTYSLKNDFSNSNANGKFTGLTAGTYTVYVKDGNDCADPTQLKVTITEPKKVDATEVTADHKDVTCYDGNDGAFTASASGGDGNYTYSLKNDFSNSNTNGKFTGLTAGTYTVYVKDGNDCADPTQLKVTITEPKEVDATEVTADHKDVTCYDGNDGAFTASASGGDGNYTYSLKNDFSNSNANGKFTGLTAGTYTVYVKDGNDCTDPTQLKVTITEPDEVDATEVTADHKDVTCYDGNDGAFTASASGGDGNYTYSLKNDFSNSNANGKFTGLTAGTYTVYVKDGNDCTDPTQLKVTITEPDEVDATEVTADHKDVTCYDGNDGAFTASASGGDGNYTYSLKNDFSNSNANGKFTGLTAGTYTVYVKDGNDCTDPTQLKVTITEPDEVDATEVTADHKDVTCYDGNDGAFTASASGGDGNYTYSLKNDFSNSNANGKFTGLTAGTYTVYVKDGNDCTDPTQLKVTITEPDEVDATEVTADHKDVTCYDGNDGAFTASASGGDGNYTYSLKNDFSNSNANGKFTGLTAGTYTVYVKDGNDCTDPTQLKVTITEPDEVDATEVTADHKDVTCYDGNDGAFTASASGGDGNYTYSLKNDFSNSNANGKFTGLTAGTYTVYVKDGNDCTDPTQLKVTITEPDEVDATEVTADHKDVTCYDGNDGAFTASASGGDGNYTYSLKNDFSNSNTNGKFTGLTAGTYTVYVKDGNDCTDPTQLKVTITEPDEVDATEVTADHKDVTCYDGNDGAFTASASGGDGNYTYSLKNDFSNSNANGKFTGLTAGTYTVYVKDGNDCTDPDPLEVTITEPKKVDATEVTADHKDVTCYDGNDGAFTASASGGDGNYTYSLKNDFSNSNANGKFTGLTAGTYTVYVKDGNDCTDPTQLKVTITEPDEVDATEVTADHKDVTCYDGNDGAFTASASGGDGNYTYSLKNDFSNSNANGKFTGLTAGTYTVYVKDGNDCTDPTQLKLPLLNRMK